MTLVAEKQQFIDDQRVRAGEKHRLWYRTGRIFTQGGHWYIQTREGIEVGPYACEFDAELEADALVEKLARVTANQNRIILNHKLLSEHEHDRSLNSGPYTDYVEVVGPEALEGVRFNR